MGVPKPTDAASSPASADTRWRSAARHAERSHVTAENWQSPATRASREVNDVTAVNGASTLAEFSSGSALFHRPPAWGWSVADGNGDSSRGGWWSARKFIAWSGPRRRSPLSPARCRRPTPGVACFVLVITKEMAHRQLDSVGNRTSNRTRHPATLRHCGLDPQRHCQVGELAWSLPRSVVVTAASSLYKGHRYPAEIIAHCVWLYHRFPLSFREVEELMLQRGVVVSYETIRAWCAKFGQAYANQLRRRRRPARRQMASR